MKPIPPLISVEHLKVGFTTEEGTIQAVDDLSYEIYPGETLGIVGESGCGKTVSALSLLRLVPDPPGKITGGKIVFEGQDLLALSPEKMRQIRGNQIAMIFQEPMTSLNPTLTIGYQVGEPLRIHRQISRRSLNDRVRRLLDSVHIADSKTRLKAYPHQFSGGMRQRAMIAMGLSCAPKLIIADEPTTALDVTIQAELLQLLKKMTIEAKTALLIITHNLGLIARYADRVHVMYAGKIVEKAHVTPLYKTPLHPYTKGLLASVPRLDQTAKIKLSAISGTPPNMAHLPQGCAFYPRCPVALDICNQQPPALKKISTLREVACWHEDSYV